MTRLRLRLLFLAALLATPTLKADILVLKNGDRKEGTTISETPEYVRFRYQLTPKIPDEKNFPRADIAELIRERPSEVELKNSGYRDLVPSRDMMTADEYERLIQDKLRPFINKHPGTPEAEEVEKIIQELSSEKQKVVSGQLKVDGKWLTPEEVKRDDYNIRAYRARQEIEQLAASNRIEDWSAALKLFDRFVAPQNGFISSTHYPELVPTMIDVLNRYEAVLLRMISEQPILQKARDDSMASLIEPDLSRTKAAIQKEVDAWKAVYDAESRSRVKWLTPYKYDLRSLQGLHKTLVTERANLQNLDLESLAKQNELLIAVYRYMADGNVVEAETALGNASAAIGTSDSNYSRIFADLRGKIGMMKQEQSRQKAAARTFNNTTGAIAEGTGAIVDDRVAAAMAEAEASISGTAPNPTAGTAAPAGTDAAAAPNAAPTAAPTPAPAPVTTSAPPPAAGSGFPMPFLIGAVVLLLVLIIAMMAQKKKQQ
ncbi:MAG: hypothetical protein KDK99_20520 [Verrucomicrobiales bacterium]|nr:hypothetical protein [Verrucomicrobiales bacterium]